MALDLFFAPKKLDFAFVVLPGFQPDAKQTKARDKLIANLVRHFQVSLDARQASAVVSGFPAGELTAYPGYFHWSLHGAADAKAIESVIDWFYAQNWVCIDPQDAGFDNRDRAAGWQALNPFSDLPLLLGARLRGIELSDPDMRGLIFRWQLADEREAELSFIHHDQCSIPTDLTALISDQLVSAQFTQTKQPRFVDRFREDYLFKFASGCEIRCDYGIVKKFGAYKAPKSKW